MVAGGEERGEGLVAGGGGGGGRRRVEEGGERVTAGVATVMGRLACRNGSSLAEEGEQQSRMRRSLEGMVGKPLRAQSR